MNEKKARIEAVLISIEQPWVAVGVFPEKTSPHLAAELLLMWFYIV